MASKKEIFEQATEIMDAHEITGEAREAFNALLEPKAGGKSYDLSEVTHTDEDGVIIAILDSASGLWLTADVDTFYEDKSGKGIPTEDEEVTLKRVSKAGYQIASKHKKAVIASKNAIFSDVLDGELTPEEGKAKVAELEASTPDYSSMEDDAVDVA